jgi:hypothetical protein
LLNAFERGAIVCDPDSGAKHGNEYAGRTCIHLVGLLRGQYYGNSFCSFGRYGYCLCRIGNTQEGSRFYPDGRRGYFITVFYEALTRFPTLSPLHGKLEQCLPFDRDRNEIVTAGECCGLLHLKSLGTAQARVHKTYCEIKYFGQGSSPATTPSRWPNEAAVRY